MIFWNVLILIFSISILLFHSRKNIFFLILYFFNVSCWPGFLNLGIWAPGDKQKVTGVCKKITGYASYSIGYANHDIGGTLISKILAWGYAKSYAGKRLRSLIDLGSIIFVLKFARWYSTLLVMLETIQWDLVAHFPLGLAGVNFTNA